MEGMEGKLRAKCGYGGRRGGRRGMTVRAKSLTRGLVRPVKGGRSQVV